MARLTATKAFNIDTFNLSSHFNASTNVIQEGPFRIGFTGYDARIASTDNNAVGGRTQLLAYADDLTYTGPNTAAVVTGGDIGSIQFNTGFGTNGWASSFRLSAIDVSATSLISVLDSDSAVDDRAFLASLFTGNDQFGLSQFADKVDGGTGRDKIDGYNGNDSLLGGAGDDTIDGGIGNDNLQGNVDNDNLQGGRGNDTLNGGEGNDLLRGGSGYDVLTSGNGEDIFDFKRGDQGAELTDYNDVLDLIRVDVSDTSAPGMVKVQDDDDTVVTFEALGLTIRILNIDESQINLNDFIFV